jgi:hypothetical protein
MLTLTWPQVHVWRLEQQMLAPRLGRRSPAEATERVLGVQAQVTSAAEMSVGARVDGLRRKDVQNALWQERTLVKVWVMRGTIHVLAAEDLPMFVAARCAGGDRFRMGDFRQIGLSEAQYYEFVRAVPEVLGERKGKPVTREALASGVAERLRTPHLRDALLGSSWGNLWKPSMFRGEMCFGPSEGRTHTFVDPRKWLHEWKQWEPGEAQREITRRYLQAYGPATPQDFSFWWDGGGSTYGKRMFAMLGDEVETVEVEGWEATALKSTLDSLASAEAARSVRLLPMFDVYVLTRSRHFEHVLAKEHKGKVFRPAAWVSAVVLVDGKIEGVWAHETKKDRTTITVSMFAPPSGEVRKDIEVEAKRLGGFLDTDAEVEFADSV